MRCKNHLGVQNFETDMLILEGKSMSIRRRDFLKTLGFVRRPCSGGWLFLRRSGCGDDHAAGCRQAVDRHIVDLTHNIFLRPAVLTGWRCSPRPAPRTIRKNCIRSGGCRCFLHSQRAAETRTFMLDYAYTPDALAQQFRTLGLDAEQKSMRSSSATAISTTTAA